MQLVHYEAARRALAEAVQFDDVMKIKNVAEQAAIYAKQANDQELIEKATEIKMRAQRKAGEMLKLAADEGQRATRQTHKGSMSMAATCPPPSLAEIGITRDQSSRYQQLAAMPAEHFETAIQAAKDTAGEVTTAFMLREAAKHKPQGKPKTGPKAQAARQELKAAQERGQSMLCSYARLLLGAIRASEGFTADECRLLDELAAAIATARSVSA